MVEIGQLTQKVEIYSFSSLVQCSTQYSTVYVYHSDPVVLKKRQKDNRTKRQRLSENSIHFTVYNKHKICLERENEEKLNLRRSENG